MNNLFILILLIFISFEFVKGSEIFEIDNSVGGVRGDDVPYVDVIITVKTRLVLMVSCVDSLIRFKPPVSELRQRIIFVDDGSPSETILYEKKLCFKYPNEFFCASTTAENPGYTFAVNLGIQFAENNKLPLADAFILLNSDTIVTRGWLPRLFSSLYSNSRIMMVGPLSNAATYQSVPNIYDSTVDRNNKTILSWSKNPLPPGLDIDLLAASLHDASVRMKYKLVDLPILNGFCMMFKSEIIHHVGLFDVVNFPRGYGEEVDFSIRISNAGYLAKVVPYVYVYHMKTASFQSNERNDLKTAANKYLKSKYKSYLKQFSEISKYTAGNLSQMQDHAHTYYQAHISAAEAISIKRMVYFVPKADENISFLFGIIQEVLVIKDYGVECQIAVPTETYRAARLFGQLKAQFPFVENRVLRSFFFFYSLANSSAIPSILSSCDVVVSADVLTYLDLVKVNAEPRPLHILYLENTPTNLVNSPTENATWTELQLVSREPSKLIVSKVREIMRYFPTSVSYLMEPYINKRIFYFNESRIYQRLRRPTSHVAQNDKLVLSVHVSFENEAVLDTAFQLMNQDDVFLRVIGISSEHLANYYVKWCSIQLMNSCFNRNFTAVETVSTRSLAETYRSSDFVINLSTRFSYTPFLHEAIASGSVVFVPSSLTNDAICSSNTYCVTIDQASINNNHLYQTVSVYLNEAKRNAIVEKGIQLTETLSVQSAVKSFLTKVQQEVNLLKYRRMNL